MPSRRMVVIPSRMAVALISADDAAKISGLTDRFIEAMDNDFNTAQGLGLIFETVKDLNRVRQLLPAKAGSADISFCGQTSTCPQRGRERKIWHVRIHWAKMRPNLGLRRLLGAITSCSLTAPTNPKLEPRG